MNELAALSLLHHSTARSTALTASTRPDYPGMTGSRQHTRSSAQLTALSQYGCYGSTSTRASSYRAPIRTQRSCSQLVDSGGGAGPRCAWFERSRSGLGPYQHMTSGAHLPELATSAAEYARGSSAHSMALPREPSSPHVRHGNGSTHPTSATHLPPWPPAQPQSNVVPQPGGSLAVLMAAANWSVALGPGSGHVTGEEAGNGGVSAAHT